MRRSIRGKEEGKVGRSKGKKKLVVIGLQRYGRGIYKVYARQIENAGVKELKPFFEDHIDPNAKITTDGWRSYTSLKTRFKNIKQIKSNNGKNFDALHRFIMELKSWLRGIHGAVRDLQPYLDEYTYRFNRHKSGGNIFNLLLQRMIKCESQTYKQIFSAA